MNFEFAILEAKAVAEFIATLIREGIRFEVHNICGGWRIEIIDGRLIPAGIDV